MTTETQDNTRSPEMARAIETLNGLDGPTLIVITSQAQLAYQVQEATKSDLLRRIQGTVREKE